MTPPLERLTNRSSVPAWVRQEHIARYQFAARYVKGKAVIDCACGEGFGSELFANAGAQAIAAFDQSKEAITSARTRCPSGATRFEVSDGRRLPLADHSADCYICLETIEHIENPQDFLSEAVRLLKPEGLFICSTPNRWVTNPGSAIEQKPLNRFHTREYSPPEFLDLLGSAFKITELYGQTPVSFLQARSLEFIGRRFSRRAASRLNQGLKLPRFLWDPPARHVVRPIPESGFFEYLVAVCRKPNPSMKGTL